MEAWQATVITWTLATVLFWAYNAPFLALDITRWPPLYRYKLQPEEVSAEKMGRCVRRVLFNQFVVQLPVSFLLQPLLQARGIAYSAELPSAVEVVLHLLIFLAVEEILFYYSHRALHLWNYQRIHKVHHEFRAPISIASEYAHPVEYVVSNMLPLLAGPLLMGSHLATVWVWTAIAVTGTSNHHCGYALPWLRGLSSPRFHDHHHLSFNTNFGLVGLLDHLHGTGHKPLSTPRQ